MAIAGACRDRTRRSLVAAAAVTAILLLPALIFAPGELRAVMSAVRRWKWRW